MRSARIRITLTGIGSLLSSVNLVNVDMNPTPSVFHVENTTACNLYCKHCTRILPSYQSDMMPWSIFERLLRPMKQHHPLVILNGHGEPLVHHDFKRQFLAVAEMSCRIRFQTNGQKLTEHLTADLLGTGAWDRLDVSIDAASSELYGQIRVGGKMVQLRRNLVDFCMLRKYSADPTRPLLNVEFVAMRMNIHELPEVVRLAAGFGAASVLVTELVETEAFRRQKLSGKSDIESLLRPAADQAKAVADERGIQLDFTTGLAEALSVETKWGACGNDGKVCRTPWWVAYIKADGRIQPCCRMSMVMGDLTKTPFDEIWNGEVWQKLRADIEAGSPPQQCRECTWV